MNYVLGGDGFIGSHVAKAFDAVAIQHDLRTDPRGKLDAIQQGDTVFYAAHMGSIDECAKNPDGTREVNVLGTIKFFEEVKKRGALPIYFSTNMVFDGSKSFYTEQDIPNPATEYGKQKREVEKYIQNTFEQHLIIRMTKVYGPGSRSFIDSWVEALRNNQKIRAVANMYAAPVFIDDVMLVLQRCMDGGKSGVFHVSGPRERALEEIARLVALHVQAEESLVETTSLSDLLLLEKRPVHNSLACDTVRDIPEILQTFYT